eukprot:226061_1
MEEEKHMEVDRPDEKLDEKIDSGSPTIRKSESPIDEVVSVQFPSGSCSLLASQLHQLEYFRARLSDVWAQADSRKIEIELAGVLPGDLQLLVAWVSTGALPEIPDIDCLLRLMRLTRFLAITNYVSDLIEYFRNLPLVDVSVPRLREIANQSEFPHLAEFAQDAISPIANIATQPNDRHITDLERALVFGIEPEGFLFLLNCRKNNGLHEENLKFCEYMLCLSLYVMAFPPKPEVKPAEEPNEFVVPPRAEPAENRHQFRNRIEKGMESALWRFGGNNRLQHLLIKEVMDCRFSSFSRDVLNRTDKIVHTLVRSLQQYVGHTEACVQFMTTVYNFPQGGDGDHMEDNLDEMYETDFDNKTEILRVVVHSEPLNQLARDSMRVCRQFNPELFKSVLHHLVHPGYYGHEPELSTQDQDFLYEVLCMAPMKLASTYIVSMMYNISAYGPRVREWVSKVMKMSV